MAGKDNPLITPYDNPAMTPPGNEGDLITARGCDPNINYQGESALKPNWDGEWPTGQAPADTLPSGMEIANSVSGLPLHPDRFAPSETPPSPPDLTDRNPGTIDQR